MSPARRAARLPGVYRRISIVLAGILIVLGGTGPRARQDEGGAGRESRPPTRPALAIYRPVPRTPVESDGTDLRPLVRALLSVDTRGRVTGVRIKAIEPSTRLDVHFRRAAVAGLGRWRFRPELRAGRAVPVEVPVSIRFEPRSGGSDRWEHLSMSFLRVDSDRELRRMQILALPGEQRRVLRRDLAEKGRKLLSPGSPVTVESEHFRLMTDAPAATARTLLSRLEQSYQATARVLGGVIPFQPASDRVITFVFAARRQYLALARSVEAYEWSAGLYHPAGLLALHLEWPEPEPLLATLIHEAAHALVDRHITRPGVLLPRWLDEGLATYMGFSELVDGVLVPGGRGRWLERIRFVPEAPSGAGEEGGEGGVLERRGRPFTLEQLMGSGTTTFYGERRQQYYEDSWRAVHFLRHGREEWKGGEFPRFILYLAEGYDPLAAFRHVYGAPPSAFEREFRRHARAM